MRGTEELGGRSFPNPVCADEGDDLMMEETEVDLLLPPSEKGEGAIRSLPPGSPILVRRGVSRGDRTDRFPVIVGPKAGVEGIIIGSNLGGAKSGPSRRILKFVE